MEKIKAHNQGEHSWTMGITQFADMTPKEFKLYIGSRRFEHKPSETKFEAPKDWVSSSVDWVTKGAVTPVKNQGQCGSCWSFSTTGAMEGAWQVATNKLVSLSEEQLVECSKQNNGCQGGSMDLAFMYEEGVNVCTEDSYPYTSGGGSAGSCKASSCTAGIPQGGVT